MSNILTRRRLGRPSTARGLFGEALYRARTRAGLTQEEVARPFGRHRVTIAKYEAGRLVPNGTDLRGKLELLERMDHNANHRFVGCQETAAFVQIASWNQGAKVLSVPQVPDRAVGQDRGTRQLPVRRGDGAGRIPRAVDYFVLPHEEGNPEKLTPMGEQVAAVYGRQPRELDVVLPSEDREQVFPQWYKCYRSGTSLWCKGDGKTAMRLADQGGEMIEIECPGRDCEFFKGKKCAARANLMVVLPRISLTRVFQIDTGSVNGIIDINSGLDSLYTLCGKISMVPCRLRLVPAHGRARRQAQDDLLDVVTALHVRGDAGARPRAGGPAPRAGRGRALARGGARDLSDSADHARPAAARGRQRGRGARRRDRGRRDRGGPGPEAAGAAGGRPGARSVRGAEAEDAESVVAGARARAQAKKKEAPPPPSAEGVDF